MPRGQRRHDGLARRRQPALATVAYHPRGDHQVLHLIRLVALELRSFRPATRSPRSSMRPAAPPCRGRGACAACRWRFGSVASSMPLGLITGRPFSPFSRAFSSRSAATTRFNSATSPRSSATWASSSARDARRIGGRGHEPSESYSPAPGQTKNRHPPGVLPRLPSDPTVL